MTNTPLGNEIDQLRAELVLYKKALGLVIEELDARQPCPKWCDCGDGECMASLTRCALSEASK